MRLPRLATALVCLLGIAPAYAFPAYQVQHSSNEAWPVEVVPVAADGADLPVWMRMGHEYVVGAPGEFAVRFHNRTAHAVRIVVGVDGVNVLDGARWQIDGRGYIIPGNATLLVKCDANGAPLRFSQEKEAIGEGEIRWSVFKERIWWADPRKGAHLPTARDVAPSQAADPAREEAFHSATPYEDQVGVFYYDQEHDLVLGGVLPAGVGTGWWKQADTLTLPR